MEATTGTSDPPPLRLAATGARVDALGVIAARLLAVLVGSTGAIEAVWVDSGATGSVLSLTLVAIAPALWRGRARARSVGLLLVVVPLVLPMADVLGAFIPARGLLAVALLLSSRVFPASGDPTTRSAAAAGLVAGVCALAADVADMKGWIAHPVLVATAAASIVLLGHALGPWRRTPASPDEDRCRVAELVARRGTDTLSPFALRTDNTYFFDASREAVLAYRVVAGVALVSGSPIGAADRAPSLIRDFLAYTRHRGWTAAAIGLSDDGLAVWRAHGFDGHYTGDEAIVQPALFTLDGRAVRKVRQSVSRLTSRGYRTLVVSGRSIDDDLAERLAGIADRWRGPARETGFSMAFESAAVCRERDDVYVLAVDGAGDVRGFLHLASVPAGAALSLSSMRRDRDTPNGLNEFLICSLLDWAREHGVERVSLNFSAFAAVLQARGPIDHVTAFEQRVLRTLSGRFQLERLHAFSAKFATSWEPRYAAYPGVRAVPRVALAAMLAEAYLAPPRLTKRRR